MRRFALFAECLTAGLLTLVAALPVVTLLAACAAGCAHVREHVDGGTTSLRSYVERFRAALPGSLLPSLAVAAAVGLLAADAAVLRTGLPGAGIVAAAGVVAGAMLAVFVLRAAALWSPDRPWSSTLRTAARRAAVEDPGGSLLLVLAAGVLVVVTWQLLPLFVPMLGCVLMAAVAVDRRGARPVPEEL